MSEWHTEAIEDCLVHLPLMKARKLQTEEYRPNGRFPIIDQGQTIIAGWTDDESGLISQNLPVVVFGDHTRTFKFVDFPFVRGADGTQILKPKSGIDPLFFYYALRAVDLPSRGYNRHFRTLKEKEISVPLEPEQANISRVLKIVEAALTLQEKEVLAWGRCKKASMQTLFTRGLRGEAQKETEFGPVPESWTPTPCDKIFKLTSGKTRPNELAPNPSIEKSFAVLGGNGVMGYASTWNVQVPETLVIGRVGEYCGAVHLANGKVWITDNALYTKEWLMPEANLGFVAKFLEYFDLNRFKRMAGQPLVTQGMISEHFIPLPALQEQQEIVAILDAIDRKIELHKRKRDVLDELFKSLLHKLMTGEIRVGDLDLSALKPSERAEAAA